MSYDFSRAIPTDNPKSIVYQAFKEKFGEDGNLLVIGIQSGDLFKKDIFTDYIALNEQLRKVPAVDNVLSVTSAVNLVKNDSSGKLKAVRLFSDHPASQAEIDSCKKIFLGLPFYRGLLYNPATNAWLIAIHVNKNVINSAKRNLTIHEITRLGEQFGKAHGLDLHYSGLPLIRTIMAIKISREMTWFLLASVVLSAVILLVFFRSVSTMFLSLGVVITGVLFSLGTMHLLGYKITLLNALTPPLMVVIGIPNCVYFLNKYHTAYLQTGDKRQALLLMISKMGIVTLFCNISAAIGFGVFALTRSAILNEFGVIAGINIMMLFFISFILIPSVLSYLPPPKPKHIRYLDNKWLLAILRQLETWTVRHRRPIYAITLIVLGFSVAGILRLRSEGFIVDDLPKKDPIYTDMKFFERNFKGVMPLEIVVDTRKKNGIRINTLTTFAKIDSLSNYIGSQPEMARPLSLVEGIKFLRQAYYDGDSADYGLPNSFDAVFLVPYLTMKTDKADKDHQTDQTGQAGTGSVDTGSVKKPLGGLGDLINSFVDSNHQQIRISVNMADVGSRRLPEILQNVEQKAGALFDSSKYTLQFTGSSVTFLEGSSFIIQGLKSSIVWAFVLIAGCMLYLFRSLRILICSLIPNIIPLVITAGVMGWTGVRLKPSTVIVFSIALGIAIDITIRFLVNYKQELGKEGRDSQQTVIDTIYKTGISIIYTSLVLIAGFVIFCFSTFGGIQALGWLTSLTLVVATLTNLIFLPVLLMSLGKKRVQ